MYSVDFGDRFLFRGWNTVEDTDDFLSALRKSSTADDVGWVLFDTVAPLEHTHDTPTEEDDDCSFIDDLI